MSVEKKQIQISELGTILEECARQGGAEFDENHWEEHKSRVNELLETHEVLGGRVFRLRRGRSRRSVHKKTRFYNQGGLVISKVHLILDLDVSDCLRKLFGLFFPGLYFEDCTIGFPRGGFSFMRMPHSLNIVFHRTMFVDENTAQETLSSSPDFGSVLTPRIMNFREGSSVAIESCDFGGADLQIQSHFKDNTQNPEIAVRMQQVEKHVSEANSRDDSEISVMAASLNRLELVANRGIGQLDLLPPTKEYVIRGGNEIESLYLRDIELSRETLRMYVGLFETIDPGLKDPYRHRELFLQMKRFATNCNDRHLLRSSAAQIERIEYFLAKQDFAAAMGEVGQRINHCQRLIILWWGWFCSNFHRSWLRCIGVFLCFYFLSNAFTCGILPQCVGAEFWEVTFRPIPKIPFLAETIETLNSSKGTSLTIGAKVWVGVIGILQTIFAGMCTFSLVKSLKP